MIGRIRLPATLIALGLCLAAHLPAAAQPREAVAIDLDFDVRVAGVRAFSTSSQIRLDGNAYAVDTSFRKEGVVAALTQTFNGRNRVTGQMANGRLLPRTGLSVIETRSTRTWEVRYRGDGGFSEVNNPEHAPKPERVVTAAQKQGAFDPLTAGVLGAFGDGEPCGRTYPIFDSRRRFNIELRKVGTVRLDPREVPNAEGDAIICQAFMHKVAGYAPDNRDDDENNRNPPKLYLAKLKGAPGWLPVKLEMQTSFGALVGKLNKATVRPMTDTERSAFRR